MSAFEKSQILPPELSRWVYRNMGALIGWTAGLLVAAAAVWGTTFLVMQFYDKNPAYPLERYTVSKGNESVALVCQAKRATMGLDTCLEWTIKHNGDVVQDGLKAGEVLLLPNGR
jgi:hypothetical protein